MTLIYSEYQRKRLEFRTHFWLSTYKKETDKLKSFGWNMISHGIPNKMLGRPWISLN